MIGIAFTKNLNEKLCRSNRLIALGRAGENGGYFRLGNQAFSGMVLSVLADGICC